MDEALQYVWDRLTPLPHDFRLIEGTALALYFGHRESIDLDWLCVETSVGLEDVFRMRSFDEAGEIVNAKGGGGMVDCELHPHLDKFRSIYMTFMEPHPEFVHTPIEEPLVAPSNEVLVAHPLDLIIGKLIAITNRATERDYRDLTYIAEYHTHLLDEAITHTGDFMAIASKIARIPPELEKVFDTTPLINFLQNRDPRDRTGNQDRGDR